MLQQKIFDYLESATWARVDAQDIIEVLRWEDHSAHVPVLVVLFRIKFPIEEPSQPAPETAKVRPTHLIRVAAEAVAGHPGPPF
jgi:hypothetical protein